MHIPNNQYGASLKVPRIASVVSGLARVNHVRPPFFRIDFFLPFSQTKWKKIHQFFFFLVCHPQAWEKNQCGKCVEIWCQKVPKSMPKWSQHRCKNNGKTGAEIWWEIKRKHDGFWWCWTTFRTILFAYYTLRLFLKMWKTWWNINEQTMWNP